MQVLGIVHGMSSSCTQGYNLSTPLCLSELYPARLTTPIMDLRARFNCTSDLTSATNVLYSEPETPSLNPFGPLLKSIAPSLQVSFRRIYISKPWSPVDTTNGDDLSFTLNIATILPLHPSFPPTLHRTCHYTNSSVSQHTTPHPP